MVLRKILHLDLDAFFCSVEELQNPSLRGRPFAVGGQPEERGVVAACSYAARRYGVRSAMPMGRALKLCPHLSVLSPRIGLYIEYSRQVMAQLCKVTPFVEQISIDEAFLDVTALPEVGENIARRLQATIRQTLDLPCSIGVATNKLVAKVATDVGKSRAVGVGPPNAILVVPPGQEAAFLAALPVQALWGVGPKTAANLAAIGIVTVGDLAARSEVELARRFGKLGYALWHWSRGIDDRSVVTSHRPKSVSKETTFPRDVVDEITLRSILHQLAAAVGRRLRRKQARGYTVTVKIRWPNFRTMTRQRTLRESTDEDEVIFQVAWSLFRENWSPGQPLRLIGVGVHRLEQVPRQLTLWDVAADVEKEEQLRRTMNDLRQRFGVDAVRFGSSLTKTGREVSEDNQEESGSVN